MMPTAHIIDGIKTYFDSCPLIDHGKINLNYIGAGTHEFSIIESPDNPVIRKYLDGTTIRLKSFAFMSVRSFGADVIANIDSSTFFEDLISWIEEQNRNRIFPDLPEKHTAKSIEVTATGFVFMAGASTAQMQIQVQLTYYKGV
jgi:hypothetical protein